MPPPDDETPVPSLFRKRSSAQPPQPPGVKPSDDSTAMPKFGRKRTAEVPKAAVSVVSSTGEDKEDARKTLKNASGRVYRVEYPDRTTREFKYDGQGQLSVVLNPDGTVWSRDGDGVWTQFGRDGETVAKWKGHFVVDDSGHFLGDCVFD